MNKLENTNHLKTCYRRQIIQSKTSQKNLEFLNSHSIILIFEKRKNIYDPNDQCKLDEGSNIKGQWKHYVAIQNPWFPMQ